MATSEQTGPGEGALAELARDPSSRKKFLKMMGGAGAASALSLAIAACGDDSSDSGSSTTEGNTSSGSGSSGSGSGSMSGADTKADLAIVNYALTLEYLEADFYAKVAESGLFKGAQLETLKVFGQQEADHVVALEKTANSMGKAVAKPKTKFPLESAGAVLKLATDVENLGANAYLGQAGRIKSKEVLAAALSIHSVEARHAAVLNRLSGRPVSPDGAFAAPASMDEVLPIAKMFIVS